VLLIPCPHCGLRNVSEFRYGGEMLNSPPAPDPVLSREEAGREWRRYVYLRTNAAGPQEEWWFHRAGCRRWFTLRRDTLTNQVNP
jgi:sarcosine oxidase subunit delta